MYILGILSSLSDHTERPAVTIKASRDIVRFFILGDVPPRMYWPMKLGMVERGLVVTLVKLPHEYSLLSPFSSRANPAATVNKFARRFSKMVMANTDNIPTEGIFMAFRPTDGRREPWDLLVKKFYTANFYKVLVYEDGRYECPEGYSIYDRPKLSV